MHRIWSGGIIHSKFLYTSSKYNNTLNHKKEEKKAGSQLWTQHSQQQSSKKNKNSEKNKIIARLLNELGRRKAQLLLTTTERSITSSTQEPQTTCAVWTQLWRDRFVITNTRQTHRNSKQSRIYIPRELNKGTYINRF